MNLGDYVTGSFIQKTQKFSSTPKLIPVQVYVEGNEDVFFWKKVLKKYERKYLFSVVTNKTATGGSNGKDALTQIKNLHLNKIICVDADFDLLIDGYHPYTSTIRDNSYIIHTEYYSIENILGQGCSLKSLIQSISNMESTFNFDDFLQVLSKKTYHLLLFLLASLKTNNPNFGFIHFNSYINSIVIKNNGYREELEKFELRYLEELNEELVKFTDEMNLFNDILAQKGYSENDTYKLMQGHILINAVLKEIIRFECVSCQKKRISEIYKREDIDIDKKHELKKDSNKSFGDYKNIPACIDKMFYVHNSWSADVLIPFSVMNRLDHLYS